MIDPLNGSSWSSPQMVAGFRQSPPNATLLRLAEVELARSETKRLLDLGCGAARNALPLAALGWHVFGVDLSWPMVSAAAGRIANQPVAGRVDVALAPMDAVPARDASVDFVVAQGIWNLARSVGEFRRGVAEAARIARPGAALFVFTFSRHTLAPDAQPVEGEPFIYTQFADEPQCFLTEAQLLEELGNAGFNPDPAVPLVEHNRPRPGELRASRGPVIYEGTFRRTT